MRRAERMWSASRVQFVESELLSIFNLLKSKSIFRDLIEIAPFTSLRKLTNRYTDSPYILKIIDRYATYTGSDPRKVPAVLLTIAFVEEAFTFASAFLTALIKSDLFIVVYLATFAFLALAFKSVIDIEENLTDSL